MVGTHLTKTLGGITALAHEILRSPLAQEFDFHYIATQADVYGPAGKLALGLWGLMRFVAALLWQRPALVYIHVGGNASLYRKTPFLIAARLCGRQIVEHFHAGDFALYYPRQSRVGQWFIRAGLRCAHRHLTCSEELRGILQELCPEAPVAVVPNGVETALFRPAADVKQDKEAVTFLFAGGMGRWKGERELVRAFQLARPRAPQARLMLLGHGAETIAPLLTETGVGDIITHLGPVPLAERMAFFRYAGVFVLPTHAEGMPVSVIEALAAGLPVLTTTVGAIPEMMTDGGEGFLTKPGDVATLAERIVCLTNDADLRRRLGERALVASKRFDWTVVLEQLGQELRCAVTRPRHATDAATRHTEETIAR